MYPIKEVVFSGTGKWKDGGIIDTPTYRYEVTFKGKKKTGKNVLNKSFFNKLQTGWLSPKKEAEEKAKEKEKEAKKKEKEKVTISGTFNL